MTTLPHSEHQTVSFAKQTDLGADRDATIKELMFLDAWEKRSVPWLGSIVRIRQIRRANPELAAAPGRLPASACRD